VPRLGQHETRLATPHAKPAGEVGVAGAGDLVLQGNELRLRRRRLPAVEQVKRHAWYGHRADAHLLTCSPRQSRASDAGPSRRGRQTSASLPKPHPDASLDRRVALATAVRHPNRLL